ncbi:hypothetical protein IE4803_PC00556 (plasmid) [Rhizobium etli bv. phaseoli str. IE4803]|nr:hypothetical protein IE4803_PC00556 [Rhizobium etli bv. phaseoli str. IE4803]
MTLPPQLCRHRLVSSYRFLRCPYRGGRTEVPQRRTMASGCNRPRRQERETKSTDQTIRTRGSRGTEKPTSFPRRPMRSRSPERRRRCSGSSTFDKDGVSKGGFYPDGMNGTLKST